MAPRPSLVRSSTSTKSLSRPMSAQSAHSTDSNATQPMATGPPQQHSLVPPQAWQIPAAMQYQQKMMAHGPSGLSYSMDSSMNPGMNPYQHPIAYPQANFSFDRLQSPAVSSVEGDIGANMDGNSGAEPKKKKKTTGASAANDMELRRLFRENEGRELQDIANEVKKEGKGPKAEKSKQVFGMLWLSKNIKQSKQSVPRNRVYSAYATRCGDDSLPMLNPASFGKLVRIIHPDIGTRRLGVRGESKYHYVDLSLVNDDVRKSTPPISQQIKAEQLRARTLSVQAPPSAASDKAGFPDFNSPVIPTKPSQSNHETKTNTLYTQHTYSSSDRLSLPAGRDIMNRKLRWPNASTEVQLDGPLELPHVHQYLPAGTDLDAAYVLAAVYRSHCLQAIENFRFCKTDEFCNSFKSLVGLLTVPSQKLLVHPQMAAWIEACDTLKYQRMVPLLRNIVLAAVPAGAMQHMETVAEQMCSWITQFFSHQPKHVLEAMLRPASTFVSMLSRFIRVNRAAHDVSAIFTDDQTRDAFWLQWVRGSQPLQVVEGACSPQVGGHHRLLSMLTHEMGFLLDPTAEAMAKVGNGFFSEEPWMGKQTPAFLAFKGREQNLASVGQSGTSFSRLVRFLEDLPARFPGVPVREVLTGMETVMGIAGRNMSLNQTGQALSHFWTVSLFVSEMLYWQAELGGFLEAPTAGSVMTGDGYSAPYATLNSMDRGSEAGAASRPGTQGMSEFGQQEAAQQDQADHVQNKLLRMEDGFSLPGQAGSYSKPRVSLGGETVVADDDFPTLDGPLDWNMEIKDTSNFFGQESADSAGVAV